MAMAAATATSEIQPGHTHVAIPMYQQRNYQHRRHELPLARSKIAQGLLNSDDGGLVVSHAGLAATVLLRSLDRLRFGCLARTV